MISFLLYLEAVLECTQLPSCLVVNNATYSSSAFRPNSFRKTSFYYLMRRNKMAKFHVHHWPMFLSFTIEKPYDIDHLASNQPVWCIVGLNILFDESAFKISFNWWWTITKQQCSLILEPSAEMVPNPSSANSVNLSNEFTLNNRVFLFHSFFLNN